MIRKLSVCIAVLITLCAQSQVFDDIYGESASSVPTSEVKAERKAKQQRLKQLNDSVAHNRAALALERGEWVLQAESVSNGNSAYTHHNLNENANFVFQQGDQAMVQVALNQVDPGPNGLGGITLEGRVSGAKLLQSDKGELHYTFHVSSAQLNAQVMVTVFRDSGQAMAIVSPTFGHADITLWGKLVPYKRNR